MLDGAAAAEDWVANVELVSGKRQRKRGGLTELDAVTAPWHWREVYC